MIFLGERQGGIGGRAGLDDYFLSFFTKNTHFWEKIEKAQCFWEKIRYRRVILTQKTKFVD